MAVFGKRGFADTTVLDIAEHAGMASGTVYQYFEDKGDIFRCLLADLTDRLHRETRMPADAEGRLIVRDSVLAYLAVYREYAPIFRAWWELLEPPTEFTDAWTALHDKSRSEMVRVIEDGKRRGMIDAKVDTEITADLIVAAFERPVYTKIVLGWDDHSDEELADLMSRLLGTGLGSPGAS
jgi:AcrR family transcriptional regulator